MGMFDDLVPGATAKPAGAFDDLIPKKAEIAAPNWIEKQLAKITLPASAEWGLNRARGFVMGAADPSVGAFQLGANVLGAMVDKPTLSGLVTGDNGGIASTVNRAIAQKEAEYAQQRRSAGSEGFDFARLGGNIASPVNLAAARIPFAATTMGRAGQGAAMGAAGGAMQPVTNGGDGYWGDKATQAVAGAAVGGVAAPVLGKLGEAIARRMRVVDPKVASQEADQVMRKALEDIGQTINDLPPQTVATLRNQVVEALKQGKRLDPAAMLRKQDFTDAGIPPLLGQITRDPMQFAREQNLRGVANVGEPISAILTQQNQKLQSGIGSLRAGAFDDAYMAGDQVSGALKTADEGLRRSVTAAYQKARMDTGKDLDIPLQGLAQDVADVVNNFGDKVPSGVMNQFRALGLDPANPSNQRQLFTIESADKLLKVINNNVGNDPATNRALGVLRDAVKKSVLSVDATGGPFAPAVSAAANRFKLQDAVPALKAAAEGSIAPDDFIRRFVINGKTNEVSGLAKILKATDPEAYGQARAQIGAHLNRAAFGENVTADKPFAAERFNKALREIGNDKLRAFFTPAEVSELKLLGRVGAYIHQAPPAAAVNYSNTASTLMNLMNRVPGMPAAVSVGKAAKGAIDNAATVRAAVGARPPVTNSPLAPEEMARLSDLLSLGAFASGGFAGRKSKQ